MDTVAVSWIDGDGNERTDQRPDIGYIDMGLPRSQQPDLPETLRAAWKADLEAMT